MSARRDWNRCGRIAAAALPVVLMASSAGAWSPQGAVGKAESGASIAPANAVTPNIELMSLWPEWSTEWLGTKVFAGERVARIPFWTPVLWRGGDWNQAARGWPALDPGVLPRVVAGVLEAPVGGAVLMRPVAAHPEHMAGIRVTGAVQGPGRLLVRSGSGQLLDMALAVEATDAGLTVTERADGWLDFEWLSPAGALVPRLEIGVGASGAPEQPPAGAQVARFQALHVAVPLPVPTTAELDARIENIVVDTLDHLLVSGRDQVGPRSTHFWVGLHNVDTGAPLGGPMPRAGYNPVLGAAFAAVDAGLGERQGPSGIPLATHLDQAARDFLEMCISPDTGLPRRFDPSADRPADQEAIEVAAYLDFLIDMAGGPHLENTILSEDLRAQAFEAARRMGHALLDFGVLPNGEIAAVVRAADGWISTDVVHLRRLDVPAQLVRLAALCRAMQVEPEFQQALVHVAREAVFEVEFTNYWPGTWDRIDPGFDDSYGHIGARSATMAAAWPDEPAFARLAMAGREKYMPMWRDALAFGGSVAADQVRCWKILDELDALNPAAWSDAPFLESRVTGQLIEAPGHKPTKDAALRADERFDQVMHLALANHLIGEATDNASWLDVTIVGFAPATNLPVGDVIGLPQNLFAGFATIRAMEERRGQAVEALLCAELWMLLDVIQAEYQAEYGFADGRRSSGGGIRLLPGLIRWLDAAR